MNSAAKPRRRGSLRPCLMLARDLYRLCPKGLFPRIFCLTFGLMRGSVPPPVRIPKIIAYPIMRHAASHKHFPIRMHGIEGLGMIEGVDVLPILEAAIEDENQHVKANAIKSIAGWGTDTSWAILERCLDHDDSYVRRAAISSIGIRRLSNPKHVLPLLASAAEHPDVEVQKIAIFWISHMRGFQEEHLPLLKRCLSSDHKLVRILAALGIEKIEADPTCRIRFRTLCRACSWKPNRIHQANTTLRWPTTNTARTPTSHARLSTVGERGPKQNG